MLDKHQSVQVRAHSPIYLVVILVLFASAHAQQPDGKVQMVIPGVKGVLEINVGPTTSKVRVRPDGMETQMQAMDRPDHLAISAFLQRVKFPASPERCRSEWWSPTEKGLRSHGIELEGLRESMADGIARVEFIVPEANGVKIKAKDVHAYLGSGELCAEVHLSKVMFEPQDQSLFEEVLASAKLLPDALPKPAAGQDERMKYIGEGSRAYLEHNYKVAATAYQRVLDLEKQKRVLGQTTFRVLVDNLGMSYGISGNLSKAKETFEYGLTQDSEYPLFYYNMACTYAEMGEMQESLEQLRLAYKYKANMIPGEGPLPDPLKDSSFRNFVKDSNFVKAVREMQQ